MSSALRTRTGTHWRPVTVPCDQPLNARQAKVLNIAWFVGRINPKSIAEESDTIEQIALRIERRSAPGWPTSRQLRNARQSKATQDPSQPMFDDHYRAMAWQQSDYDLIDDVAAVLNARFEDRHGR